MAPTASRPARPALTLAVPAFAARALAALALTGLLCASPVAAFSSVPPGSSPHDDVTEVARELGWPDGAVAALQQAVRKPDYIESEYDPQLDEPGRIDASNHYAASHHCDREPPADDNATFHSTVAYIQRQRESAVRNATDGEAGLAMRALGRALHALQDCYSHSNVVDMDAAAQAAYQQALLAGGPPVAGLRLVSYQPGADEPGRPDGDPYGHDDFNKDSPEGSPEASRELPDGRTKYEAARDLARNATKAFLEAVMAALPAPAAAALLEVEPEKDGGYERWPIPASAAWPSVLALAGAAAMRRRR